MGGALFKAMYFPVAWSVSSYARTGHLCGAMIGSRADLQSPPLQGHPDHRHQFNVKKYLSYYVVNPYNGAVTP